MHSLQYAFRDRRARKGEFRQLWIQRINAACRLNGISYSRFIAGLKRGRHRGRPQGPRRPRRHRPGGVHAPWSRRAKAASPSDDRRESQPRPPDAARRATRRSSDCGASLGRRSARRRRRVRSSSRARCCRARRSPPGWPLEAVFVDAGRARVELDVADVPRRPSAPTACSSGSASTDVARSRCVAVGRACRCVALDDLPPTPTVRASCSIASPIPATPARIMRSAEAAGADAVVLARGSVDPFNPKVVRAVGRRAVPRAAVVAGAASRSTSLRQLGLRRLGHRRRTAAHRLRRRRPHRRRSRSCSATRPTGCRRRRAPVDELVTIPMRGPAESPQRGDGRHRPAASRSPASGTSARP